MKVWTEFLQTLQGRGQVVLSALLAEAEPKWEDDVLVLKFSRRWQWHIEQLNGPRRRELEEAVREVWPGAKVTVRLADVKLESQGDAQSEALIEKVVQVFEGEHLGIREKERGGGHDGDEDGA